MNTTTEAALKQCRDALADADQFITNGVEFGYIRMPDADTPDTAHNTPGIVRAALAAADAALTLPDAAVMQPPDDLLRQMEARKDAAYLERNQVVAALAKCFPSGVARTAIEGWSEDWHGAVYIDLPTGQASWHFHDSHAYLFDGLPAYKGQWDGHDTPEKYRRLAAVMQPLGAVAGEPATADQCIELTAHLERLRAAAIVAEVARIAAGRADTHWCGWSSACEEVAHRLKTEAWSLTLDGGWKPTGAANEDDRPSPEFGELLRKVLGSAPPAPVLPVNAQMLEALKRIERWFGEFPETGDFWDAPENTRPMSYGAAYGSNGERDYMRGVARAAITAAEAAQAQPAEAEAVLSVRPSEWSTLSPQAQDAMKRIVVKVHQAERVADGEARERMQNVVLGGSEPATPSAPMEADTATLVGVTGGVETVLGEIPMPAKMKARELVREMFGAWEPDDGSDPDMAMAVCEQLIEWLGKRQPAAPAAAEPVARVVPFSATVRLEWASVEAAHNAKPGPLYASPQPAVPTPAPTDQRQGWALLEDWSAWDAVAKPGTAPPPAEQPTPKESA